MEFKEGLPRVIANLVAIHSVYNKFESRFRNFGRITRVWTNCSLEIIKFKGPQSYLITDEEMVILFIVLYLHVSIDCSILICPEDKFNTVRMIICRHVMVYYRTDNISKEHF